MDRESTSGRMEGATKVSGSTIICMGKACTAGEMEECTKESIWMIKSMVLVSIHGQMDVSITGCGKMVSSMERENTYCHRECRDEANGKMVIESGGLIKLLMRAPLAGRIHNQRREGNRHKSRIRCHYNQIKQV